MSLARNDMLTTGNNRAPRARRSCYVDEPAFGFFVAGSTHKQMNGLYIRRNVPRPCPREHGIILYYEHMDSGWTMLLADCEAKPPPSAWGYERQAENAWFFVDPRAADRFTHPGDTIVPGAGVRWKHVHRSSGAQAGRSAASGHGRSSQLATAEADDEDELPWQVIAILDHDILRQLAGGAEYHKERVAEALAGRGVVKPPALTSLEGCYLPGGVWGVRRERKGCHPPRGVLLGSGMRLSVRGVPPSRPFDTPRLATSQAAGSTASTSRAASPCSPRLAAHLGAVASAATTCAAPSSTPAAAGCASSPQGAQASGRPTRRRAGSALAPL